MGAPGADAPPPKQSFIASLHPAWVALLAVFPFLGWWTYGLFDLDEGFYGAIAQEMNRHGEWLTPLYNGHPWFEKPILLYWCAKPCLLLFGSMIGPRLPSVLATLGTMALLYVFGRKHFGETAGRTAVLVLAGSLLPVAVGRMMLVDPLLVLCLTAAFLAFWESLEGSLRMRWVSGLCLGFSVLAKGPVGVILFIGIAGWTFIREPGLRPAFRGGWIGFIVGLVAAVASWYLPAYLANPTMFVQQFLIEQNLKRFTGGDSAHNLSLSGLPLPLVVVGGFLLYLIVLVGGMLPASRHLWKAWPRRADSLPVQRYLATWAAVIFLFFAASPTKLVHYVLPCCPALALLVADYLANKRPKPIAKGILATPIAIGVLAQVGFSFYYGTFHKEVQEEALYVAAQPEKNVAVYQMPRRDSGPAVPGVKMQETSHPSLLLYLNQDVLEAETLDQLAKAPKPLWVITRANRIGDADKTALGMAGVSVTEKELRDRKLYRLYRLDTIH
jgi:4-amino-4-deoxy-L-arabinose transferase-like glycosyltransferase